jgi:FG-GAP-like repeat
MAIINTMRLSRLKCSWVCGVLGLALAVSVLSDDSGPQALKKKPTADAIDQVMHQVQAGPDGWDSEQAAAEIEQVLSGLAQQLTSSQLNLGPLVQPEFRGTPLRPVSEKLLRSENGLEVFDGVPDHQLSVSAPGLNAQFQTLVSAYRAVDWIKFKIVGIELAGTYSASTSLLLQMAATTIDGSREQIRVPWQCTWQKSAAGKWRLSRLESGTMTRSRSKTTLFTDVSQYALGSNASFRDQLSHGNEIWRSRMDAATGMDIYGHQGVAVGDYDGDGLEDFYVCQPGGLPNRLFHNLGNGQFDDVSEKTGVDVLDATSMALFADIDNSGTQDLILILSAGQPLLFLNDGRGRFRISPKAFPTHTAGQATMTSAALADYDHDGFLDLYVCAYSWPVTAAQVPRPYYDAANGPPNFMYRNRGDGTFEDVTERTGLNQNNNRYSFACAWGDYNNDGWPDLFVANDFGRKNLYRNNGNGTFTDVAPEAGVEDVGAGMSAAWGDFDGDGWEDLYVGNMWSSAGRRVTTQTLFKGNEPASVKSLYQRHARGNSLFRNRGDGRFDDVTLAAGVEMGRWAWCSNFLDFDNDGYEDLYVANGFITGPQTEDL